MHLFSVLDTWHACCCSFDTSQSRVFLYFSAPSQVASGIGKPTFAVGANVDAFIVQPCVFLAFLRALSTISLVTNMLCADVLFADASCKRTGNPAGWVCCFRSSTYDSNSISLGSALEMYVTLHILANVLFQFLQVGFICSILV